MCIAYLLYHCDLTQVSSRATLYQRYVCCQTHPVHVVTGRYRDRTVFYCPRHLNVCNTNKNKCVSCEVTEKYLCYPGHSSPAQTF